jgi:hypothetical protein
MTKKLFKNFIRDNDFMSNLYWFWYKYVFYKKNGKGLPKRFESQFNIILEILELKYMSGKWNGQTKTDFYKNYRRVKDISDKSLGDEYKAISLSKTQANRISDEFKAINRAMCAKELYNNTKNEIYMNIFEVFFQRAYELGSVSKQDYRSYKLEKLGIL